MRNAYFVELRGKGVQPSICILVIAVRFDASATFREMVQEVP